MTCTYAPKCTCRPQRGFVTLALNSLSAYTCPKPHIYAHAFIYDMHFRAGPKGGS